HVPHQIRGGDALVPAFEDADRDLLTAAFGGSGFAVLRLVGVLRTADERQRNCRRGGEQRSWLPVSPHLISSISGIQTGDRALPVCRSSGHGYSPSGMSHGLSSGLLEARGGGAVAQRGGRAIQEDRENHDGEAGFDGEPEV